MVSIIFEWRIIYSIQYDVDWNIFQISLDYQSVDIKERYLCAGAVQTQISIINDVANIMVSLYYNRFLCLPQNKINIKR